MNRHFAFLTVLVLLLCSCSADDDTTFDGSVRFDVQTDAKTRGSVIDGASLPITESFRVFAWKTVSGETTPMMARDANDTESNVVSNASGYWAPKKRYYWPSEADATVDYYAFYPKDYIVQSSGDDLIVDFTVPAAVSSQHDLMAAKTEDISLSSTSSGIYGAAPLTFHHLTSQVSFRAQLAPAFAGWQVTVRSIRLCNVNSRGSYNYTTDAVTPASPAVLQNYDLVMAAASTAVTSTSEPVALTSATDVAMLMPQSLTAWDREHETVGSAQPYTTGCYIAIACSITDTQGRLAFSGNTYVPLEAQWQKTKSYTYTLQFGSGYTGSGDLSVVNIALSCSIADWQSGTVVSDEFRI